MVRCPRFWIFNRTGFYGKGLIRNEMYISRLIGMPGQLVEALPVDILSHDTVEAKLLQPAVNVNVTLYEEMLNFGFFFWWLGGTKMAKPTWRCCLNLGKCVFFWGEHMANRTTRSSHG